MSYPHFPLRINLTVLAAQSEGDCLLTLDRLLPFAPYDGVVLRFWRQDAEGEEDTLDLTLTGPVYSFADSAFVVDLEDDEAVQSFRDHGQGATQRDVINYYVGFGFKRVTFQQAQVIRKET